MVNLNAIKLFRAMIDDAVRHYTRELSQRAMKEYRRMVQAEAAEWLFSDDKAGNSFLRMCELTGADPEAIRAKARKARKAYVDGQKSRAKTRKAKA